jgi:hypothetical protein
VSVINDEQHAVKGKIALSIESDQGAALLTEEKVLESPALGQHTHLFDFTVPRHEGAVVIKGIAKLETGGSTTSWRKTRIAVRQ